MHPVLRKGNVQAHCPDCNGAITTFESKYGGNNIYGMVHGRKGLRGYANSVYVLLQCAGCGRGGLAAIGHSGNWEVGQLDDFFPKSIEALSLPQKTPTELVTEFREAELAASVGALRASSALLRSVLEKALKLNGYNSGNLASKIDTAGQDGVLTASRVQRAHEDIRVLGNDVLHDEWREVKQDEVDLAHRYCQRILEDFYDDRDEVEKVLIQKKRIASPTTPLATPNP